MYCDKFEFQIGRFLDDELTPETRADVSDHLRTCAVCQSELASLREIASKISSFDDVDVPTELWGAIAGRISDPGRSSDPGRNSDLGRNRDGASDFAKNNGVQRPQSRLRRWPFRSRRWALAAALVFVVGLGFLGQSSLDNSAKASTINFGVLLDALPLDTQNAFRKFLAIYDAKPGSPLDAKTFAPSLDFEIPPVLPGGFRRASVYLVRFGGRPGVAASYERNGKFLAIIFHTPVTKEDFGTHKDYPCVIGKHHGHKVEVGTWKIVHLTDQTTCHCVLSQLDETSELPAVMAAVAPRSTPSDTHHAHLRNRGD